MTYGAARATFVGMGLGERRPGRFPFSSNFRELRAALGAIGVKTTMQRWQDWGAINGRGIIKVWPRAGRKGDWHWVAAASHPDYGVVVHDPDHPDPSFLEPPQGVMIRDLRLVVPFGNWIRVLR